MRLSKFTVPSIKGVHSELASALQKRDDEIRNAVNANQARSANAAASWMSVGKCSKPGMQITEVPAVAGTYATAVPSPPYGTRRVVTGVAYFCRDTGTKQLTISCHDGTSYWEMAFLGVDSLDSYAMIDPGGVVVLGPGDTIEVNPSTNRSLLPGIVYARWADERVDGENEPSCGSNFVRTDGETRVELVPEPPAGTVRVVRYVTTMNTDVGKTAHPYFAMYDGSSYTGFAHDLVGLPWLQHRNWPVVHADELSSDWTIRSSPNGTWVVPPGYSIYVSLFTGDTDGPKQVSVTAHWFDHREEGEGEN